MERLYHLDKKLHKRARGFSIMEIQGLSNYYGDDKKFQVEIEKYLENPWSLHLYEQYENDCKLEKSCLLNPVEAVEGMFKCPKCGTSRTISFQVQKRRADEPMTNYITCCNPELIPLDKHLWKKAKGNTDKYTALGGSLGRCNHRWHCN